MAGLVVNCEKCGAQAKVGRKNARICPPCAIHRDLVWAASNIARKKCRACKEVYRPRSGYDLKLCAGCEAQQHSHAEGPCALCKADCAPLVHALVPLCLYCVKDPEKQRDAVKALGRGWTERLKNNKDRRDAVRAGEIPHVEELASA